MIISGWGRYPVIRATPLIFRDETSLAAKLKSKESMIPFGNGRSYGDSALARYYAPIRRRDRLLEFNEQTGLLTCEAGILLSEIIETFLPRGWFLKVTPGTKLITVGGAIAADVHGKNHHQEGCFGETVESFVLMLADGEILHCSRKKNYELFKATCGGMGLTGIILQASFYLKKVFSNSIEQVTIKTNNLGETFDAFEEYARHLYSVAWMDGLAQDKSLGRSLLMVGDFDREHNLGYKAPKKINIPYNFPGFILNRQSIKAFNNFYYSRAKDWISKNKASIDSFFYPLDALDNWNRIYGRKGFVQYQCILPKNKSYSGLEKMLKTMVQSGMYSFLTVLKLHGPANENYLSFPLEGYSLAMDFKIQPGLLEFLNCLDEIVIKHHGRIYLAKDARVSKEVFEKGYPDIDKFRKLRSSMGMNKKFNSLQSQRLGL